MPLRKACKGPVGTNAPETADNDKSRAKQNRESKKPKR